MVLGLEDVDVPVMHMMCYGLLTRVVHRTDLNRLGCDYV